MGGTIQYHPARRWLIRLNYHRTTVFLQSSVVAFLDALVKCLSSVMTNLRSRRFRWVVCQLEALKRSFPSAIRWILNDLPESLDETVTYDRILLGIA
ncbi:hypothetical protein BC827DRAFT_614508 [Russula dissimulans]|nr:hypothetical protein BC827DRAFT_614508 [Russula dissimulans]